MPPKILILVLGFFPSFLFRWLAGSAIVGLVLLTSERACAQAQAAPPTSFFDTHVARPATKMPLFAVQQPDKKLSPYTGMTRRHWQDAARYLLAGAFSYVHTLDAPMQFPKQPGKSYPRQESQVPTEKLEGLCRTLFMAAPLLKEQPDLMLNGIRVADYYRQQLTRLVDPVSPTFIKPRPKGGGPSQTLVEFGGLSVSLFAAPEILWDPLPKPTRDALAATMLSYGDGPTVPQNWRYFNVFILSFLDSRGYAVNKPLLEEYLGKQLTHYDGAGWYNDGPNYDYYSMWAFQMYGRLWSHFYGQAHYPVQAAQLLANFAALPANYPYAFGRDGRMVMWGRSIGYRFAAAVPFPLMGLEPATPNTNFGWMRRIASGAMLQFLQNPDFLQDNVPTLGFYGEFAPAVQGYSCRGSMYWLAKLFLGLLVPADSPFWMATENEGPWGTGELSPGQVFTKFEPGSNVLLTDYPGIGASEIRARCHIKVDNAAETFRGGENYNRLSYNSAFPWQADGLQGEVAMNYVVKSPAGQWEPLHLYTFKKFENGVYYREAELEGNPNVRLRLADMPLPNGILRVDQNVGAAAAPARLGHYALPNLTGQIKRSTRQVRGYTVKLIDNGTYQLASVPLSGWSSPTEVLDTHGLNPVQPNSTLLNLAATLPAAGSQPVTFATLLLWKKSGEKWTDDELVPVRRLTPAPDGATVTIELNNGTRRQIAYEN